MLGRCITPSSFILFFAAASDLCFRIQTPNFNPSVFDEGAFGALQLGWPKRPDSPVRSRYLYRDSIESLRESPRARVFVLSMG